MYTQNDTEAAIRRIQDYLYEIHLYEGIKYFASRNGVYTDTTARAISDFQKKQKLPITGIVDLLTFERLRDISSEYRRKSKADSRLYTEYAYPLKKGSQGNDVEVLHALLRALAEHDENFPSIPRSAYFSAETENAIRYVQKKLQAEESGAVDAIFFERLENELEARLAFLEKE